MSPTKKSTYRYSLLALLLVAFAAFGADLEKGKPEDVGLSSSRLNRIEEVFGGKVKAGEIPGYVALVARHGKVVYFEANGVQDPNTKKAMSRDSIFRISSMTKPLTSVAARARPSP